MNEKNQDENEDKIYSIFFGEAIKNTVSATWNFFVRFGLHGFYRFYADGDLPKYLAELYDDVGKWQRQQPDDQ